MDGPGMRPRRRGTGGRLGGLSPRRKLLAVAAAILLAAGAAAAAVGAASGGGPGAGAVPAGYPPQDRPGPVLLVPGYGGRTSALAVLAARIRATGRQATVLRLPGGGTGSLSADAGVLNAAVTRALAGGAPSVDVIGYSAGGVVALLWARRDDGVRKARRVVTLGAPFHGTSVAAAAEGFVPGACPLACQQLVPGSSLLASLDAGDSAGLPRWMSLWTADDRTVTPPGSARLPGAVNVPIQSVCPRAAISHSQLPTDPAVTAIVLQAIGPGPMVYPAATDCRG
ncbi:MAG: esterase/lipase family protein [Streptosporangiaceae bacterium]|jgi:triacylglycerol esterase/lipase EstA (alpha/beta hydrolase family)